MLRTRMEGRHCICRSWPSILQLLSCYYGKVRRWKLNAETCFRPLHYACVDANPEIVQLWLGCNAHVEAEDGSGRRPLHNATIQGSVSIVGLLLRKGVDIEARDVVGDRPLCMASSMGHLAIVRMLLDRGASPEV